MHKKIVEYKVITHDNEDARWKSDASLEQFLRACEPEINAERFNRKFVSISNECISWLKEWRATTQKKRQQINIGKEQKNPYSSTNECRDKYYRDNDRLQFNSNDDCSNLKSVTFSFLPVVEKGPNYLEYCTGWLSEDEKPSSVRDCIRQYTSGPNWFCSEINFSLAADSATLSTYNSYIKQLKYCIGMSPGYVGTVFRGKFSIHTNCSILFLF